MFAVDRDRVCGVVVLADAGSPLRVDANGKRLGTAVDFRLLGELEVDDGGRPIRLRGRQERTLLASLLLHANESVARERLVEVLWRGHPPASALHSLEASVSRLRKALSGDGASIESRPDGYRLSVRPERMDVRRFEQLVQEGRSALASGDAAAAARRLAEALSLWRGRPFSELAGGDAAEIEADRLEEVRLSALEARADAELELGRHAEIVGDLQAFASLHPLREGAQRRLMLALYRCGRQAEALDVYREGRRRLVEELGAEPGPELQSLHTRILRHDPALDLIGSVFAGSDEPAQPTPEEPKPQKERKVVTVLICEAVAATAQAAQMDPEDAHVLFGRFREHLRAVVEQYGGTITPSGGNTVVVFFGVPRVHEDDAERAVRAALAIRDAIAGDDDLQVRIGLHTGEALVVLDAQPETGESSVSSAVVETASRLAAAAPANSVLVGERTVRASEATIRYREQLPLQVEGPRPPLPAWEALGARPPGTERAVRHGGVPFVGREQELTLLCDVLDRVCTERTPQLVTLVGAPGIGKSRLVAELRAEVEHRGRPVVWRQGRSLPYGDGVSYWALADIVKGEAGILEADDPEHAARKLRGQLERLLPDAGELDWVEAHVRPLVGIGGGAAVAADAREASFAAWRRLLETIADARPLALVLEDLHWADEGLLDFVEELSQRLAEVPVLVLATARPLLLAERPTWAGGKANALTISLPPLGDGEAERLVRALPGAASLPEDIPAAVVERAGGNPLYLEELTRVAVARTEMPLPLPESLQAIIAARLDALATPEKALIQNAAVVGAVFWPAALRALNGGDAAVVERQLHELERHELVRRERQSSLAGEEQYAFRHELLREVAYRSIPRAVRLEHHRSTGEWIESLGRPDDHADLLAHHYATALELARETGAPTAALEGPAVRALRRAGDRAFSLNAFPAAIGFYDRALALGVGDDVVGLLLLQLGTALDLAGDERRIETLERARDTLLVGGDVEEAAEACERLAGAWRLLGNGDRRRSELERAQELLRGRGPSATKARVLARAARCACIDMEPGEAARLAQRALEAGERLELDEVVVSALNTLGMVRSCEGDAAGGSAMFERAIALGLAAHLQETPYVYNNLAVWSESDDVERGRELYLRGLHVAEKLGNRPAIRFILGNLVGLRYRAGEWDEALADADALVARSAGWSDFSPRRGALLVRACVLLARDDEAGAEAAIGAALADVRGRGDPYWTVFPLTVAAWIYRELGRDAEALAAAEELLPLLRPGYLGAAPLVALALEPLGLGRAVGDALIASPAVDEAPRAIVTGNYGRAAELLDAAGDRTYAAATRMHAARVLATAGRTGDARPYLERALTFYRGVGATRYIREGEVLLGSLLRESPAPALGNDA